MERTIKIEPKPDCLNGRFGAHYSDFTTLFADPKGWGETEEEAIKDLELARIDFQKRGNIYERFGHPVPEGENHRRPWDSGSRQHRNG